MALVVTGALPATALLLPETLDYGASLSARRPTSQERRVLRAFAPCREDRRLTVVARVLARGLRELGDPSALEPSRATFLARRLGVADAALSASAVAMPTSATSAARALRAAREWDERAPTHCGAGLAGMGRERVIVLVTTRRLVEMEPFPSRPVPGAEHVLTGRIARGFRHPRVLVTPPSGVPHDLPLVVAGRTFHAAVETREAGVHRVEVMVEGPSGPEAAAILPLHVGVPPPLRPVVPLAPEPERPTPDGTASAVLGLLLRARASDGLPPLVQDPNLTRIARSRAEQLRIERFVGHRSRASGDLGDHFRAEGLSSRRVAENVGRGSSAARIHSNFMESPAHRATILDEALTHVGVGVSVLSTDPPSALVVEVFAAEPRSTTGD